MDLLHESVEVHSPLSPDSHFVTEQVHQHGLARPYSTAAGGTGGGVVGGGVSACREAGLAVPPTYRTPQVNAFDFSLHCSASSEHLLGEGEGEGHGLYMNQSCICHIAIIPPPHPTPHTHALTRAIREGRDGWYPFSVCRSFCRVPTTLHWWASSQRTPDETSWSYSAISSPLGWGGVQRSS